MHTELVVDENKTSSKDKTDKLHIGNLKLSKSKQAIKVHLFNPERFAVIPIAEITVKSVGKVYEYVDGNPEIIGEISKDKNKPLYTVKAFGKFIHLQENYINLLSNGSELTLGIYEE